MPRALCIEYPGVICQPDETAITLKWIAKELHMATWTHVANLLQQTKGKIKSENQHELNLV